jgi:hypothetical protein
MTEMKGTKGNFVRFGWTAAILLASFWAGAFLRPQPASTADIRKGPPKQHFLAGSERSVPILQDISETLKRMDDRLARIEKIAAAAAKE